MSEMDRITADAVRRMFDARLTHIGVASTLKELVSEFPLLESLNHYSKLSTTGLYGEVVSWLRFDRPGLQLLLGRNGSGKSRLLNALCASTSTAASEPSVSMVFELPSVETDLEWQRLVGRVATEDWFLSDVAAELGVSTEIAQHNADTFLYDLLRLPLLEAFIKGAVGRWGQMHSVFRGSSPADVIERFGFSEAARADWHRSDRAGGPLDAEGVHPSHPQGLPTSYSHRHHAAALFLSAMSRSSIARSGRQGFAELDGLDCTDSGPWLDDPAQSALVGAAYEQLISSSDRVIYLAGRGVRFVSERPLDGPLKALFEQATAAAAIDVDGPYELTLELAFPFDLVEQIDVDGSPCVATGWFPLPHLRWSPISVVSVNLAEESSQQIEALVSSYADHFLRVQVQSHVPAEVDSGEGVEGTPTRTDVELLAVAGFERLDKYLDSISEAIALVDVGVSGLRLGRLEEGFRSGPHRAALVEGPGKLDLLRRMRLEWQQPHTNLWLGIDAMSRGQRDVVLLMLAMGLPAGSSPEDGAVARFVVVDEFDYHLHPSATAPLLERLHRRAVRTEQIGIFSTHSIPVLSDASIRHAPRILAERSVGGLFTYSRGRAMDAVVLAEVLGVDVLEASRLTRLFVLVEGKHDETVLRHLLGLGPGSEGVEIVNALGTWSFDSVWDNLLRHHGAPVLVVYDKRSAEFESCWKQFVSKPRNSKGKLKDFHSAGFATLRKDLKRRYRERATVPADGELRELLDLAEAILLDRSEHEVLAALGRVHFHGVVCDDIADLLPINEFPLAAAVGADWGELHRTFDSRKAGGKSFKEYYGINDSTIRTALGAPADQLNPELQRLYDRVISLASPSPAT